MAHCVGGVLKPHVRPDFVIAPVRERAGHFPGPRPDLHGVDVKELIEIITDADDVNEFFVFQLEVVHREIARLQAHVKTQCHRLTDTDRTGHGQIHGKTLLAAVFLKVMETFGEAANRLPGHGGRGGNRIVACGNARREHQQKDEASPDRAPSDSPDNISCHCSP